MSFIDVAVLRRLSLERQGFEEIDKILPTRREAMKHTRWMWTKNEIVEFT
jgi:hypothetical protein